MRREALLARTVVELTDTLVDDFDLHDLLSTLTERCVAILDVAASGIMLAAPDGRLRLMTSSCDTMRVVELFELQSAEGPCLDSFGSGRAVVDGDLDATGGRWPSFTPVAIDAGFRGADAVPLRLRGQVIGALNLFRSSSRALAAADVAAAQALADVATIAILHHRAAERARGVHEHLTGALSSRVVIEQAKGIISERLGVDMDGAFTRLRGHARNHNERLADVASRVVDGSLRPSTLRAPGDGGRSQPHRRSRW